MAGTVSRGKAVLWGEEERGQERGQETQVGAAQASLGQALGKLQASGLSGSLKPDPPCGVREAAPSPPLRWISEPKEGAALGQLRSPFSALHAECASALTRALDSPQFRAMKAQVTCTQS